MKRNKLGLAAALMAGVLGFGYVGPRAMAEDAPANRESIDFRKLKELLPAELNGVKRSQHTGERNKVGDMSVSTAKAVYGKGEKENEPGIQVEVMDYGGAGANIAQAAAIWATMDIDKESDGGYEKTTKIGEGKHPAFEKYEKESKHGTVQIWVGKRYIVTITTDNIPAADLAKVAAALPLQKLAELK